MEYICVRQRAGPLVKAFSTDRRCFVRRNTDSKGLIRKRAGPAMSRTSVDKLELRLALFGYDGIFYTLTFADEFLPNSLDGVRSVWDAFLKRLKRWRKKPVEFYVYRIEGLHGDHRFHIHAFLRGSEFPPDVVRALWDWGWMSAETWDKSRVIREHGYRGLAVYFTKEVPEVGRHPWHCSRALSHMIPAPEIWWSQSGALRLPPGAVLLPTRKTDHPNLGEWGVFSFTRYLNKKQDFYFK